MKENEKEIESKVTYHDGDGQTRVLRGVIIEVSSDYVKLQRRDGLVIIPRQQLVKINMVEGRDDDDGKTTP